MFKECELDEKSDLRITSNINQKFINANIYIISIHLRSICVSLLVISHTSPVLNIGGSIAHIVTTAV